MIVESPSDPKMAMRALVRAVLTVGIVYICVFLPLIALYYFGVLR